MRSNIKHSTVFHHSSSPNETPRSSSKIFHCASYFQLSSRCLAVFHLAMKYCVSFLIYCFSYSSVSSMLTDLNWPSLPSRPRICGLGMFYKIHTGQVNIFLPYDFISMPAYGRKRASHDFKIRLSSS